MNACTCIPRNPSQLRLNFARELEKPKYVFEDSNETKQYVEYGCKNRLSHDTVYKVRQVTKNFCAIDT